jgi:4-amino-4-deoxy-L-arabinose transferase-like glycosyltransferase
MGVPAQDGTMRPDPGVGGFRADWPWLAALLLAAVALRGWQLRYAEVISRDGIDYIRIAWRLEHGNWQEELRRAPHHPGYPLVLLAASVPVRHLAHGDLPALMQLSAQLASAVAGVLLVVPMFYLGRQLFDRRTGAAAALLVQCLPASGREMADGLSEPVFLLAAAAALVAAGRALRGGSPLAFALAGLCSGMAYLTRPEGALIACLTGVVLLGMQAAPRWRRPWGQVLLGGACLTAGAAAVGGPFAWTIGGLTTKPTANDLLRHLAEPPPAPAPAACGTGPVLAVWWPDEASPPSHRLWWGLGALLAVLSRGFCHFYWLPALLGLWWFRDRWRQAPVAWVMVLLCLSLAVLLYRVAQLKGYLSERHTLLILLCGSYFSAAGLARMAGCLAGGRPWSVALLAASLLAPLPRTLEPLHADRTVFRTAGRWLAEHTLPGDEVLDPYRWAYYYAGCVFTDGQEPSPAGRPPACYLVLDQSPNKKTHLEEHRGAEYMARHFGRLIKTWRQPFGSTWAEVGVYELSGRWTLRP